jgi:hypothetical protein
VRLVSWNEDDAQRRARELKALGFKVDGAQMKKTIPLFFSK